MKVLIHTCCAPCLIYPLKKLQKDGHKVKGIFYNPNIHPFAEYLKRRQAVEDYGKASDCEIFFPEYLPEEFFRETNYKEQAPGRCCLCWALRLRATASFAKEKGFDAFTTTLLVSPYQDQDMLKKIGEGVAAISEIEFLYQDFRDGFKFAHEEAREKGIYCQNYCGCIYSEIERCKKSRKR